MKIPLINVQIILTHMARDKYQKRIKMDNQIEKKWKSGEVVFPTIAEEFRLSDKVAHVVGWNKRRRVRPTLGEPPKEENPIIFSESSLNTIYMALVI